MTNKDIKDSCKNCDVEPPAMKFKCPECEHNLDKEQIMIDGVNVNRCIEFNKRDKVSCYHILYDKCNESPNCYFKQLARKTQECELLETQLESYHIGEAKLVQRNQELEQECEQIKEKYEALKLENQEGYEIVAELKQECEELKKQLETSEKWRIKAESLNENFELKNTCYRKALEEIESICLEDVHTFADGTELRYDSLDDILNIISRAKEKR